MSLMVFRGTEVILNSKSIVERKQKQLCDQSTCLITQWAAVTAHCRLMVEAPQSWVPSTCSDNCDIRMEWAASLHFGTFFTSKTILKKLTFLRTFGVILSVHWPWLQSLSTKKCAYYTDTYFTLSICIGDRGSTVDKVLCHKSEGRWFDPSWCQWIFLWHKILQIAIWPWGRLSL